MKREGKKERESDDYVRTNGDERASHSIDLDEEIQEIKIKSEGI